METQEIPVLLGRRERPVEPGLWVAQVPLAVLEGQVWREIRELPVRRVKQVELGWMVFEERPGRRVALVQRGVPVLPAIQVPQVSKEMSGQPGLLEKEEIREPPVLLD